MIATSFDESNHVLGRPTDMTEAECDPLSVFVDGKRVVSCWKLTADELAEVNRTGRVWLMVIGVTMPPALVMGNSPFVPADR